jgi:hypothetical protein
MQNQKLKEHENPRVEPRAFESDPKLKKLAEKASAFTIVRVNKPKRNRFKSAKDLLLNKEQRDALIKTLKLMEAGKVKHVTEKRMDSATEPIKADYLFNMNEWCNYYDCGTVACLGGTAELVAGSQIFMETQIFRERGSLNLNEIHNLFYGFPNYDPTTKQAAKVLRHYLETGTADWSVARK